MSDTRTKILNVADDLVQRVGLNAMSYKHISDAVGIRKASPEKMKALGAAGMVAVRTGLQAIFGTRSEDLMTDMLLYLETAGKDVELTDLEKPSEVSYKKTEVSPDSVTRMHRRMLPIGWLHWVGWTTSRRLRPVLRRGCGCK